MLEFFKSKPDPKPAPAQVSEHDGTSAPADAHLLDLARSAWKLKRAFDQAKARLEDINQLLIETIGPGNTITIPGIGKISVVPRETVAVENPQTLLNILGPRFEDLVNQHLNFKPTQKLIEMLDNPDCFNRQAIRACLAFKTSLAVTYRETKADAA